MVDVLGFAILLGYLQASIAKMQDHRKPQGKRILFVNSLVSLIETIKKKLNFSVRSLKLIEK